MNTKKIIFAFLLSFFLLPIFSKAASVVYSLSGTNEVRLNKTFSLELVADSSNLMGLQGTVSISNPSCVEITSVSGLNGTQVENKDFVFFTFQSINGKSSYIKINLKAKTDSCDSTVTVSNLTASFVDNSRESGKSVSKKITVLPPASTNNFLTSLSVSTGVLSPAFNKNTTSYNVSVRSDVTKITLGATLEDRKAKLSGTGEKKLNYGNNKLNVTVTAEDGSKKTYTINVNREDNRSKNNYLKSLSVSVGKIDFKKGTTSYKINVGSEQEKIKISAEVEDSKAKLSGTGEKKLKYGSNKFTVAVVAENGSKKNYVITVNREDNRSSNASLKSLLVNNGEIPLDFSPGNIEYEIEIPNTINSLDIKAAPSDNSSKVTINNPEVLKEEDEIKIEVKALNGEAKTYIIHVKKVDKVSSSSSGDLNNLGGLKNIILTNGKLTQEFDPNIYSYEYTKKKDFSYTYEVENESIVVNTYEEKDNIYFVVESNGTTQVYCLHLKSNNMGSYLIGFMAGILVSGVTFLIYKKVKNSKSNVS